MYDLVQSQIQKITFVMVDLSGTEVAGLGAALNVDISKNGSGFIAGIGTVSEVGNGWYSYDLTSAETDTIGPLSISVTGAGCVQQNLEYVVVDRLVGVTDFQYTLTNSITGLPIEGAAVVITTDIAGVNVIWTGETNVFGIAVDTYGNKPRLAHGTYYLWRSKVGYEFSDPDTEVLS